MKIKQIKNNNSFRPYFIPRFWEGNWDFFSVNIQSRRLKLPHPKLPSSPLLQSPNKIRSMKESNFYLC